MDTRVIEEGSLHSVQITEIATKGPYTKVWTTAPRCLWFNGTLPSRFKVGDTVDIRYKLLSAGIYNRTTARYCIYTHCWITSMEHMCKKSI